MIASREDVFLARRAVRVMAAGAAFKSADVAEVETAVAELATNLVKHTSGGRIELRMLTEEDTMGLEVRVTDQGPGIEDIQRAVAGGFSSTGTLGIGLSGVTRLMDEVSVLTGPDAGTEIVASKWPSGPGARLVEYFGLVKPKPGQCVSGDVCLVKRFRDSVLFGVIDVLGHGPEAHEVAQICVEIVERHCREGLDTIADRCHEDLLRTRGAAVALCRLRREGRVLEHLSIGNVETRVFNVPGGARPYCFNGALGMAIEKGARAISYPLARGAIVVMCSDGISSSFGIPDRLLGLGGGGDRRIHLLRPCARNGRRHRTGRKGDLMTDRDDNRERYEAILREFLSREEENACFAVAEFGKELVLSQAGPDVLVDLHARALKKIIGDADPMSISRIVVNANDLLLNGIMAYAMTYYEYLDRLATERDRLDTSVKAAAGERDKLDEIVSAVDADLLLLDRDLKILWVNRRLREREPAGKAESLIGTFCHKTYCNLDSPPEDCPALAVLRSAKPVRKEHPITYPDGRTVHCHFTCSPIVGDDGEVTQVLELVQDITERKAMEAALGEKAAALEKANARLRELDQLKSVFLASMSHELRTPLNSIIGFTGILLQGLAGATNPEQTKQLRMVQGSARHLLALINDVLDLSKVEAGQLTVAREPFAMSETVDAAIKVLAPMAEAKGLAVVRSIAPVVGMVVSDRRRVEQVLINLLGNAVKFTDSGQVRVECRIEGEHLVTRVSDTGIGIKAEDMGKLFAMFQQIKTDRPLIEGGTGLGLSICKKLVELLGGQIRAESEHGVGSTFTFTLPLEKGPDNEAQNPRG